MQGKLNWQLMFCFPEEPPPKKTPNQKNLTQTKKTLQQETKPKTIKQNNKTKTLQILNRVGVLKMKNGASNKSLCTS